jgi:predicted dehydrogenase
VYEDHRALLEDRDIEVIEIVVPPDVQGGIRLAVNQNMRYDRSIRVCRWILDQGYVGDPVLATIEMRAVPHWMPWQKRQGLVALRIMSIHHLDTFRFLFGDPQLVYASIRPDPRTGFAHEDGICLHVLEYENGLRAASWDDVWTGPFQKGEKADNYIRWGVEGLEGVAQVTIGWPAFQERKPITLDFCTSFHQGLGSAALK